MKKRHICLVAAMFMMAGSMTSCNAGAGGRNAFMYNDRYEDFRDSQTWGKVTTKELQVAAFSGIDLGGCADVDFYQDDDVSVAIIGNAKVLALYDVDVKGDMLTIRLKDPKGSKGNIPHVLVEVHAPSIWKVKNSGTGDLEMKHSVTLQGDMQVEMTGTGDVDADKLKCNKLTVKQTGTGDMDVDVLKCNSVKVDNSGTGDTDMSGTVNRADVTMTGTGDADLDLHANDIDVVANGTGDVDLHVKCNTLSIRANGASTVEVKGKCGELTKQSSGMAQIRTKELSVKHLNIVD